MEKISGKQKTVIVLGMHRSGTSAIMNVLCSVGLYCGDDKDLLPDDQFNEKGYFEHRKVMEQNEAILDQSLSIVAQDMGNIQDLFQTVPLTGHGWIYGAWYPVLEHIQNSLKSDKHLNEYVANIYEQANGRDIALKDPRFSLTLPNWGPYLSNTLIVMMIRDPDEVSRSLMTRDKLPDYISQPLWTFYNRSALRVTAAYPRILINYSNLINHPEESVKKLFDFLELNGIENISKKFHDAVSTISPGLYHSKPSDKLSAYRVMSSHSKRYFDNIILNESNLDKIEESPEKSPDKTISDCWPLLVTAFQSCRLRHAQLSQEFNQRLDECQHNYAESIDRLNRHPIVGPVIKILRFLKRDRTFGNVISNENQDRLLVK